MPVFLNVIQLGGPSLLMESLVISQHSLNDQLNQPSVYTGSCCPAVTIQMTFPEILFPVGMFN